MTTLLVQNGDTMTYGPTGAVASGAVVIFADAGVGVALGSKAAGAGSVQLGMKGVYTLPRTAAATLTAQGTPTYITATGKCVASPTNNTYAGMLWEAVATSATTCKVNINFGSPSI